ncbi:fluoride efflux transporter FluC [Longispora albida]|uniref:fluoride efflux transporter FluC n=1 Tax=Longispora albida TaxID=203523 RepID=UPI00037AB2ED|nr:CrcB family protein [Longispora albida]
MTLLLLTLGAATGTALRYLTSQALRTPWATLTVNTTGSLILGYTLTAPLPETLRTLLAPGLCGALTTYSTLSHELTQLTRKQAAQYLTTTITLGLTAALTGTALAKLIH